MNKLDMKTSDLTDRHVDKIAKLFPNVITEKEGDDGNTIKAIDFDLLKQELSKELVESNDERYRLDWPGKKASLLKANTPIDKTLRPDREASVDFDNTENVYIEGDNFEVLKILQESYLGKVKMIYIDPPYNTGKDFVYRDNTTQSKEEYEEELGVEDEEGGKLFKNTDTNGRFHSDWLSMMYERLVVARDLLKDDGAIFMSIDDNEVHNLRKIADEVFGEENFLANFVVVSAPAGTQSSTDVAQQHSYCLAFSKSCNYETHKTSLSKEELEKKYKEEDSLGKFYIERLWKRGMGGKKEDVPSLHFPIYYNEERGEIFIDDEISANKGLIKIIPYQTQGVLGRWTWSKAKMKNEKNKLVVRKIAGEYRLHKKKYSFEEEGRLPYSIIGADIARTELGSIETKEIMDGKIFDYPKFTKFIEYFIRFSTKPTDIVLDFFAGSSTTAHSTMKINVEDGGNRKFIMAQLPEKTDEESEAFKAGYKTISEIGMERIRRAGKKILEDNAEKLKERETSLDIGFRVYKTDSTNMKDIFYNPKDLKQDLLAELESNIKDDRSPEDLLIQVILDLGLTLDLLIEKKKIKSNTVFFVANNSLIACFDDNIDFGIVDEIAKTEPLKVVFRDSCFKDDKDRINVENRFKRLSPETIISVI